MLLNEYINFLTSLPIIANFNMMGVMTKMNASPLTRVISMDIEDPNIAQCHTLGRHLANLTNKNGSRRWRPSNRKGLFGNTFKLCIII